MRIGSYFCALIVSTTLVLSGCASSLSGDTYSRDEARRSQTVQTGVITYIRTVNLEGTDSGVGKIGGAVVGGVIGSTVDGGSGRWSLLGGVVGALLGGWGGTKAEEGITRSQALEITVKQDNGTTRAIVQQLGAGESFNVGDRVRIITSNQGAARVSL